MFGIDIQIKIFHQTPEFNVLKQIITYAAYYMLRIGGHTSVGLASLETNSFRPQKQTVILKDFGKMICLKLHIFRTFEDFGNDFLE